MLALCMMLLGIYYAQIYASIIGWCLIFAHMPIKNTVAIAVFCNCGFF